MIMPEYIAMSGENGVDIIDTDRIRNARNEPNTDILKVIHLETALPYNMNLTFSLACNLNFYLN